MKNQKIKLNAVNTYEKEVKELESQIAQLKEQIKLREAAVARLKDFNAIFNTSKKDV